MMPMGGDPILPDGLPGCATYQHSQDHAVGAAACDVQMVSWGEDEGLPLSFCKHVGTWIQAVFCCCTLCSAYLQI